MPNHTLPEDGAGEALKRMRETDERRHLEYKVVDS